MTSRGRTPGRIASIALAVAILSAPARSHAALSTCNANIQIAYVSGPNFPNPGDTIRVELTLGAQGIQNGTTFTLNRVRFDLDCSNPPAPGSVPCADDGTVIGYLGDGTITTTCGPNAADSSTVWSTGHAVSGDPNEVVFTPNSAIHIPANVSSFCTLAFDITVLGTSNDSTPLIAEEVTGYNPTAQDGQCDNGLSCSSAQSGSIPLCQVCNDNNACTTESCNNDTGQCQTTSTVTCNDNNACTTEACNTSTGQCQTTSSCETTTTTSSTTSTTLPSSPCGTTPSNGCRLAAPGAASVQLKDNADDTKDQFKWRWNKGAVTDTGDFKNPVSGSATYRVCLYDSSANAQPLMDMDVPPGGTCGTGPCWKATGTAGFRYKNKAGTPDGLTAVKFKAGITGKAQVAAKGRGFNLPMPMLGLTLPVTVQLIIDDGAATECWQTTYTTEMLNSASAFAAKGP
jgi:hypothetical protein